MLLGLRDSFPDLPEKGLVPIAVAVAIGLVWFIMGLTAGMGALGVMQAFGLAILNSAVLWLALINITIVDDGISFGGTPATTTTVGG